MNILSHGATWIFFSEIHNGGFWKIVILTKFSHSMKIKVLRISYTIRSEILCWSIFKKAPTSKNVSVLSFWAFSIISDFQIQGVKFGKTVIKLIFYSYFNLDNAYSNTLRYLSISTAIEYYSFIDALNVLLKELRLRKLRFTHYLCVVIIFFNTALSKSVFSTYYIGELVFCLSVF